MTSPYAWRRAPGWPLRRRYDVHFHGHPIGHVQVAWVGNSWLAWEDASWTVRPAGILEHRVLTPGGDLAARLTPGQALVVGHGLWEAKPRGGGLQLSSGKDRTVTVHPLATGAWSPIEAPISAPLAPLVLLVACWMLLEARRRRRA